MLVDSHCHLEFPGLIEELDEVLSRADAAGIGLMVTIGTRLSRFDEVLRIAEQHPQVYCTVGVHPHEAETEGQKSADRLIEHAKHPKVVGIGETGLDYYYEHSPRAAQQQSFRAHIQAARETGLPLIVHTRDADLETADILEQEAGQGGLTGVLHCFSSGRQLAERALTLGFYISLSGILTFKKAEELRDIARDVPTDRLLVETDSPYLAPVPKRGKRNEPAYTAHVAACLAEIKGMSTEAIAQATTDNFFRLFGRADRAQATLQS